jgi:hypothetical protein
VPGWYRVLTTAVRSNCTWARTKARPNLYLSAFVGGLALRNSQQTISTVGLQADKYRRRWCREGAETCVWSQMRSLRMRSLRLAVVEWPLQNLRKSSASHVLDRLLLALASLPLALVPMYASSSLCSTHARALYPRRRSLAGVRQLPHILLLQQVQHRAVMTRQTRD